MAKRRKNSSESALDKRRKYSTEKETSRIEQLPNDVLIHIMSFLTSLVELARTSVLSRRWKNLWHHTTCLDFDAVTVLPRERLENSRDWYIEWVNKVIDDRIARPGLPLVKKLRIWHGLDASQGRQIDRWINFAIENAVETLHLDLRPYLGLIGPSRQYILSEDTWRRAPSGLSNLKCLKSLVLSCVSVSKQFIEFILSNCPLLEELAMHFSGTNSDLDVSGTPPLSLKRLEIDASHHCALTRLCAPHLTSLYYKSTQFYPQEVDVPGLTDLTIGGISGPLRIMNYLEHFRRYLPQLEKLHLIVEFPQKLKLRQMPKLVKLKYLRMDFDWDTEPIFHRILKLIGACPALETFAFEILDGDKLCSHSSNQLSKQRSSYQQLEWISTWGWDEEEQWYKVAAIRCFKSLKVLEVYGGDGKAIDQNVIKCIISKAPKLEKLIIDTRDQCPCPFMLESKPGVVELVRAKAKKLCKGTSLHVEVIG